MEDQSDSMKGIHIEGRSGDPSAINGAAILASFSDFQKDFPLLPSPTKASGGNSEVPSLHGRKDDQIADVDMRDNNSKNDVAEASPSGKGVTPSAVYNDENLNDGFGLDPSVDAGNGKARGSNYEVMQLLKKLAKSPPIFGAFEKLLVGEACDNKARLRNADPSSISLADWRKAFRDSLQKAIVSAESIGVSFGNFPYYLRCGFYFISCFNYSFTVFIALYLPFADSILLSNSVAKYLPYSLFIF